MLSKRNVNVLFLGIFLTEIMFHITYCSYFQITKAKATNPEELEGYWASVLMIIISGSYAVCYSFHC
jgi:hypothetical protein